MKKGIAFGLPRLWIWTLRRRRPKIVLPRHEIWNVMRSARTPRSAVSPSVALFPTMPPKLAPFDDVNETFSPNHFVYENSNEEEEENEAPEPAMVRALYEVAVDGGIGRSHQTNLLELLGISPALHISAIRQN
jgi:hypothetical protein